VDAWQAEMRGALVAEVAGVVADHPGVEVVETVVEGQPAQVLADLCDRVDLLVLARRTRLFPRGHLGGTARALLRELPCPVLVVPPPVPDDPCHLV
jgi:nucleotide-binding universal stress UspA family protein